MNNSKEEYKLWLTEKVVAKYHTGMIQYESSSPSRFSAALLLALPGARNVGKDCTRVIATP